MGSLSLSLQSGSCKGSGTNPGSRRDPQHTQRGCSFWLPLPLQPRALELHVGEFFSEARALTGLGPRQAEAFAGLHRPCITLLVPSHCSSASRMDKEKARAETASWVMPEGFSGHANPRQVCPGGCPCSHPRLSWWLSPRKSLFPRVSVCRKAGGGGAAGRGRRCWGVIPSVLRGLEAWALFFFPRWF